MVEWRIEPAADGSFGQGVILTGTGSEEAVKQVAQELESHQLPVCRILEWDSFCLSILDPDYELTQRGSDIYFILLRFEDWDHFSDHIRNQQIEPSYGLVRRKTNDIIQYLTIAVTRTNAKFALMIEWSEEAFFCPHVNRFFEDMASLLEASLSDYPQIAILYQGPAAKAKCGGARLVQKTW